MKREEAIRRMEYCRNFLANNYSDMGEPNVMAFDMAIKALEQTRWIPVSERLPEDGTWNYFTDGKHISVERYKSDAIDHFFPDGRWFSLEEAVAWLPLPELYRESEDKR